MKEISEKKMKEQAEQTMTSCARAQELVSYLYGEANELEAAEFKLHLEQCALCIEELAGFKGVRQGVQEWRNLSLPSFDSFVQRAVPERKRSALAAIREFFTLAPVWMRAATAMTAVLLCALVVFTARQLYVPRQTVVQVNPAAPTQAQIEALVKQRLEAEHRKEQEARAVAPEKPANEVAENNNSAPRSVVKRQPAKTIMLAQQKTRATMPNQANTSQQEARQQLAELVQTTREDDGLPRLSDLIDDSNEAQ